MNRISIKSVFLGIGIGMIVTAILCQIFLAGQKPSLTKEQIETEAKKIGMIWPTNNSK
jgi:hypothetical protein